MILGYKHLCYLQCMQIPKKEAIVEAAKKGEYFTSNIAGKELGLYIYHVKKLAV